MRLGYQAETESLYIDVADGISAECVEICDGVDPGFDSNGKLMGIDIDRVSSLPQVLKIPDKLTIPVAASSNRDLSNG